MGQSYISRTSGIGTRDKIGYAMGDLASLLVFGLVQSVLQKYYTDVLGIGVVSIMIMFIIARIWDAINDPLWGRIIDRIPPAPDGRYRRWLKILAVPVALSAVLMFVKIPGLSEGGYLAYAYVTYILFGMLYTGINIPYGSLAQVITSDDRERSSLSVFRSIGSTFGAMPAMLLISFCYVKNANGTAVMSYSKILTGAIIISAVSVLAYLLCYRWTTERVPTKPTPKEKGQTWKVIKILLHSRPYMAVCLVGMLFLAAQMFSQSYNTYLFNYYFNAPGLSMMPTVCQYLPVAVIMLFAGKLGARFGYSLAATIWGLAAMAHAGANSATHFIVARFALGIGESGNFPAGVKAVAEWFPKKERAFAVGIFNAGANIGAILTPLLTGAGLLLKSFARLQQVDTGWLDMGFALQINRVGSLLTPFFTHEPVVDYRTALTDAGMRLCGMSPDGRIVEMLELPDHPYFLATQAHPEFNSRPNHPHPLFLGLISSAVLYRSEEL